jgi:hypothetical protein
MAVFTACKKEDALTPTPVPVQYKLPQGNNSFDGELVSFNTKWSTYFLYKFSVIDFGWQPSSGAGNSNGIISNYSCDTADVAYVEKMLPFIKNNWLNFYPDTMLKIGLPYKILLGKNLKQLSNSKMLNTLTGYNHIAISNFSPVYDTMTVTTKKSFRSDINIEFWNWMLVNNRVAIPVSFSGVSSYALTGITTTIMYQYGFLSVPTAGTGTAAMIIADELNYVRAIINNTKAQLDATILSATTDTKGLVVRKYNALISYYKTTYNLDLQAIGNTGLIP